MHAPARCGEELEVVTSQGLDRFCNHKLRKLAELTWYSIHGDHTSAAIICFAVLYLPCSRNCWDAQA